MTNDEKLILYIGEKNISSWSMRGWLAMHFKAVSYTHLTLPTNREV